MISRGDCWSVRLHSTKGRDEGATPYVDDVLARRAIVRSTLCRDVIGFDPVGPLDVEVGRAGEVECHEPVVSRRRSSTAVHEDAAATNTCTSSFHVHPG